MTDKILAMLDSRYPLRKKAVGEFAEAKLGPMKFQICSFEAAGLGSVSVMKGSGLFGLMKMDTIIVNPFARDMALFSCDREEKRKAAQVYTEGLLNHGGPSTGLFIKTKGLAYTQKLYREVMFGTGEPEK